MLLNLDQWLLQVGNISLKNSLFDFLLPFLDQSSNWLAPIALAVIGVIIFGGKKGRWVIIVAALTVLITDQVSSSLLKPLAARIRPCNIVPDLHVWWEHRWVLLPDPVIEITKVSYSFPSSHAANSAGQAIWWGWNYPQYRWWFVSCAGIIGYSRVYLGHHWPLDVVGGWLLGGVIPFLLYLCAARLFSLYFTNSIGSGTNKASRSRTK